jgi:hypothetical protein
MSKLYDILPFDSLMPVDETKNDLARFCAYLARSSFRTGLLFKDNMHTVSSYSVLASGAFGFAAGVFDKRANKAQQQSYSFIKPNLKILDARILQYEQDLVNQGCAS